VIRRRGCEPIPHHALVQYDDAVDDREVIMTQCGAGRRGLLADAV
jgi:hypothetical protein